MAEFIGDSEPVRDSTTTAPIDTLPNELITHIFTMGSTSEPPHVYGRTSHSLPFPLLVSSISRRWRDTAISSPPLWSQLLFTADALVDSWMSCLFLPRSGAHPLDIRINLEHADRSAMERVLEIILPHCERWRKLFIIPWGVTDLAHTLRAFQDMSVPLLQQVEIFPYEAPYGDEKNIPVHTSHTPFFQLGAPALTSVILRRICAECGPPLANLTAFVFDYKGALSQRHLQSIVAASPALRVLRLRLRSFTGSGQGQMNIPSLRELSLNFGDCASDDDFLLLLSLTIAPDLESLEISSLADADAPRLLLNGTQSTSCPRLQTLKLSKLYDITLSSYHTLFALFPTITSLTLLDGSLRPALPQLPALKHITYGQNPHYLTGSREEDRFVEWICRHVRGCHGTPQAMESVHTNRSARKIRETIGCFVDVVELADGADSLRGCWDLEYEDGEIGSFASGSEDAQWDEDFYPGRGDDVEGISDSD
ncbi:hypothetical protein FIBSPDRAFT_156766 [Athelia psychrophila]|uniref:F-box domain-containing protein n=1 Tax=Athelia psychrophila TaxID=1759441 RepID=A0A166BDE0_9AGAM|nr:hypothetical protein FIBSPDRAFT_156766 [Fibularhizoctonia sp. CBS 109695]